MAKKAQYIVQTSLRDERFCAVLKATQHIDKSQALQLISKTRIESYIKQGVIKRVHYLSNKKSGLAYELTKKGRTWINKRFPHFSHNSYTSSTAVRHNLKMAEIAIEHARNNCQLLCERDLREYLNFYISEHIEDPRERDRAMQMLNNREISVPDMAVVRANGTIECVEVITENYPVKVLEQKAAFEAVTGLPITYVKQ